MFVSLPFLEFLYYLSRWKFVPWDGRLAFAQASQNPINFLWIRTPGALFEELFGAHDGYLLASASIGRWLQSNSF